MQTKYFPGDLAQKRHSENLGAVRQFLREMSGPGWTWRIIKWNIQGGSETSGLRKWKHGEMTDRTRDRGQEQTRFSHMVLKVPEAMSIRTRWTTSFFLWKIKHWKVMGWYTNWIWSLNFCYFFQLVYAGYFGRSVLTVWNLSSESVRGKEFLLLTPMA